MPTYKNDLVSRMSKQSHRGLHEYVSPFIECDFCGGMFDRKFHRFCPNCIEKAENAKEFQLAQKKAEQQANLVKFLNTVTTANQLEYPIETVEPLYEVAVREIFALHAEELGYTILKSMIGFPDYILELKGEVIRAEAELRSSNFKKHKHDPDGCDLIICWKHDWKDCPLPVLALESF